MTEDETELVDVTEDTPEEVSEEIQHLAAVFGVNAQYWPRGPGGQPTPAQVAEERRVDLAGVFGVDVKYFELPNEAEGEKDNG